MSIIPQLASSQNRKDETPNIELAKNIIAQNDADAVNELITLLQQKKKDLQNDSIKVLYEVGAKRPDLVAPHRHTFLELLNHKNNRLQWGAMTALATIAPYQPKEIYEALPTIMDAAEKGSVITMDNAMAILIVLCQQPDYEDDAFALLNDQLKSAPTNQLPMYAERAMPVVSENQKSTFVATLVSRLGDIDKDSKRKRVEKVIKKLSR